MLLIEEFIGERCVFCSEQQTEDEVIFCHEGRFLCIECFSECEDLRDQYYDSEDSEGSVGGQESSGSVRFDDKITAQRIYDLLETHVIGQRDTKVTLSIAAINHIKRINTLGDKDGPQLGKSNVLIYGPTGSGKTLLVTSLSKILGIPLAVVDATLLTEAGYIGQDIETILTELIVKSGYNLALAETGIVFIDEIDKKAKEAISNGSRDVSGIGVQQGLLRILEGSLVTVPLPADRPPQLPSSVKLKTDNILFICGGAFVGLERIVAERISKSSIGFKAEVTNKDSLTYAELRKHVTQEDFIKFGMIPEFIGRFGTLTGIDLLTESDLIRILTEPRDSIVSQYTKLFKIDKVDLVFHENTLQSIAKEALSKKIGARGLRTLIEERLRDHMFALGTSKVKRVVIDSDNNQKKDKDT